MANSWWEKFLNLFTEEIPVEEDIRNPDRRPGRMGEIDRGVGLRVIHHYPHTNKAYAPVVIDRKGEIRIQPRRRRRSTSGQTEWKNNPENLVRQRRKDRAEVVTERRSRLHNTERRTRRNDLKEEAPRPPREKFTGVNFRASDVPSPVYGFRKRPVSHKNKYNKAESPTPQISDTPAASSFEKFEGWEQTAAAHVVDHEDAPVEPEIQSAVYDEESTPSNEVDSPEKQNQTNSYIDESDIEQQDQPFEKQDDILNQRDELTEENHISDEEQKVHPSPESSYISSKGKSNVPVMPYNVVMLKRDKEKQNRSETEKKDGYRLPPLDLLDTPSGGAEGDEDWISEQGRRLSETLEHFNVKAKVIGATRGPAVTRFEVQPAPGVKVNKIKKLNDDLKLSLAAKDIRIEAPIPGKSSVGIEIPNRTSQPVHLREMIESHAFENSTSPLTAALGLDISGAPIVTDLRKMPHGLIGGATGSGKSVCINSLLISLLYKATPEELKLILIDPKVVELAPFKDIPHLAAPVINDAKEAALALKWAVEEMERRYEQFAKAGARDIARYNRQADEHMPYIVIVIDELADLMMVAPHDVEESICRIAQKARACGIHLMLATQRPSVDVITGLIKANIPTRLAFSVSAQADSRTILDMGGAEKLLGHGDMLFVENGAPQAVRVQGNFVSDDEIDRITDFVKQQSHPDYLFEKDELQETNGAVDTDDELFEDACFFVFEQGSASASSLQRRFRIGYNRAARLIEMMEARGMISEAMGSKPRDILLSEDEFLDKITNQEA